MARRQSQRKQHRLVKVVAVVLVVIGAWFIAYPFFPLLMHTLSPLRVAFPYQSRLEVTTAKLPAVNTKPLPEGHRLVIPGIGVDIAIVEGTNENAALDKGAWRIPNTASSPLDGNMVLSAHRFRYRPPTKETFYLLDKLKPGDVFILYWDGEEFDYRVRESTIVEPNAVEILQTTPTPQVTLFTCTPLFSTSKRLVVVGDPI